MKHFVVALILMISFLSARAAEISCACSGELTTHAQESNPVQEHKDHCQHTCTQCHFAALVVPHFFPFKPSSVLVKVTFIIEHEIPKEFSQLLYRPPIS